MSDKDKYTVKIDDNRPDVFVALATAGLAPVLHAAFNAPDVTATVTDNETGRTTKGNGDTIEEAVAAAISKQ